MGPTSALILNRQVDSGIIALMKMRNFFLLILLATVWLLQACSGPSSGDKQKTDSPANAAPISKQDYPASMLGKVEGFLYSDGSRRIITQSATPPASFSPVAGVTVVIPAVSARSTQPNIPEFPQVLAREFLPKTFLPLTAEVQFVQAERRTVTDGVGHFLVSDAVAGPTTLIIDSLEIPILVIPGATVQVGNPTVTREVATQKVLAALPQVVSDPLFCYVMGSLQPVPAGTQLGGALDDNGPTTLDRSQWLFYVDGQPGVKFEKNVTFFLVDAESGAVNQVKASSWPALNGFGYFKFSEDNEVSPCLIRRPELTNQLRPVAKQEDTSSQAQLAAVLEECPDARSFLLTVSGSAESDEVANLKKIKAIFGKNGIPPLAKHLSYTSLDFNRENPSDDVKALLKKLYPEARPCDLVFVYICSHGAIGGPKLETTFITADQTITRTRDDGTTKTTTRPGHPVGFTVLNPSSLDFTGCKACTVVLFLEYCHAGGFIQDGLGFSLDPKKGPLRPTGLEGKRVLFVCSAEHATNNPDGNSVATGSGLDYAKRIIGLATVAAYTLDVEALQDGGVFTNAFINRLRPASSEYFVNMVIATSEAVAHMKTISLIADQTIKARKQNPCFLVQNESNCKDTSRTTATSTSGSGAIPTTGTTTGQLVTGTSGTTGSTTGGTTGEVTGTGSTTGELTAGTGGATGQLTTGTGGTTGQQTVGTGGTTGGTTGGVSFFPDQTLQFIHRVGVTQCPQLVGTYTLTNSGSAQASFSVTGIPSQLLVTPNSGTIAPGQSQVLQVFFNCSTTVSFGPQPFSITTVSSAGSQTFTGRVAGTIQ